MNSIGNEFTEGTLSDPNVQKLLKSDKKFDVVIIEQFVNDGLKVFAHHYQAHLVVFVTFGSNAWINPLVANPAPPSYVPEQKINMDPKNFFHRVFNTIIYIAGELNRNLLFFPAQNKIMKKYFPDAPDLDVLNYNASLVLVNSHISTNKPVPRVPSMVDIGGFHINPPKKLPKDLQEYLDSAKEGVVYFSMGSTLQSINLPVEKREAILRVFSKLKQKVLWKWEDESLPGQPQNVKLGKWLPQQDILGKIFTIYWFYSY
jgi:UDP:flavonoid glycosyltransferase YjiC (YdhE family)